MFTGIIQETVSIYKIDKTKVGISLSVNKPKTFSNIQLGESVAVNGACLTISGYDDDYMSFDIVLETLNKTNFDQVNCNDMVNLERCLSIDSKIDGHIVLGHIESIAEVVQHSFIADSSRLFVSIDEDLIRFCINKGSITIDGVSLTIASIEKNIIEIALVPHTLSNTNLKSRISGDTVNIETDIIGRYIDHYLTLDGYKGSPQEYIANKLKINLEKVSAKEIKY